MTYDQIIEARDVMGICGAVGVAEGLLSLEFDTDQTNVQFSTTGYIESFCFL